MNNRQLAQSLASAQRRLASLERARIDELVAQYDLTPALRAWLRTQRLDVVQSFLEAAKSSKLAQPRVAAARSSGARTSLQGAELEAVNRAMGIGHKHAVGPHRDECGRLVMPTVRPSDFRKRGGR